MTTSNYGSGSNCGTNTYGSSSSATATCSEATPGTAYNVNEIPTPGCYSCSWNGALLRVSGAGFASNGYTTFNFTSSEPMTVTYLTDDPTASLEECRRIAARSNVYSAF
jgi:hypothetical protein